MGLFTTLHDLRLASRLRLGSEQRSEGWLPLLILLWTLGYDLYLASLGVSGLVRCVPGLAALWCVNLHANASNRPASTVRFLGLCGWAACLALLAPRANGPEFVLLCVAPLLESIVYQALVIDALVTRLRSGWLVLTSGLAFVAAHCVSGTLGPENVAAGFVLAWVYLRTRSVLLVVALHSGGNLFWLS